MSGNVTYQNIYLSLLAGVLVYYIDKNKQKNIWHLMSLIPKQ